MKIKSILIILIILFTCSFASAEKNKNSLQKDYNKVPIQLFIPASTDPIVLVTADSDVDISTYRGVMFDEDITFYYGTESTKTFFLHANRALAVRPNDTTIHINIDCSMLVM